MLMRQGELEDEQSCGMAISQQSGTMRAVIIFVLDLSNLSNFFPHNILPFFPNYCCPHQLLEAISAFAVLWKFEQDKKGNSLRAEICLGSNVFPALS